MIQLDQIRTLEQKVRQAVSLISRLKSENEHLKGRLSDYEVRIDELEQLIGAFRISQSEIEAGLKSALNELDQLESPTLEPEDPLPETEAQEPNPDSTEVEAPEPEVSQVEAQESPSPISQEESLDTPPEEKAVEVDLAPSLGSKPEDDLFSQNYGDSYTDDLFLENALSPQDSETSVSSDHQDHREEPQSRQGEAEVQEEEPSLGIF